MNHTNEIQYEPLDPASAKEMIKELQDAIKAIRAGEVISLVVLTLSPGNLIGQYISSSVPDSGLITMIGAIEILARDVREFVPREKEHPDAEVRKKYIRNLEE